MKNVQSCKMVKGDLSCDSKNMKTFCVDFEISGHVEVKAKNKEDAIERVEQMGATELDEGVQKLLDRLIFLRVAEDRGIEGPILKELLREHEEKGGHKFQSMIKKFRELDEIYNSNLFSEHPFEKWEEYGDATENVIKILYGKPGYYEYDFKVMPADVLGGVYENYLGYRLEKSRKGLSVSKDAKKRKEHGIYYTPDFIVDYIVKNTLKPVLDKCTSVEQLKKIKVLDPACGSGSASRSCRRKCR